LLFSSNSLENIRVDCEGLLWGFSHKRKHLRDKWGQFLSTYQRINPFDVAVIQPTKNYRIHAIGVVREKYYDDLTPVWPAELRRGEVLYPWRVSFSLMLFSEEPITVLTVRVQDYISCFGLGTLTPRDLDNILAGASRKFKLELREST